MALCSTRSAVITLAGNCICCACSAVITMAGVVGLTQRSVIVVASPTAPQADPFSASSKDVVVNNPLQKRYNLRKITFVKANTKPASNTIAASVAVASGLPHESSGAGAKFVAPNADTDVLSQLGCAERILDDDRNDGDGGDDEEGGLVEGELVDETVDEIPAFWANAMPVL